MKLIQPGPPDAVKPGLASSFTGPFPSLTPDPWPLGPTMSCPNCANPALRPAHCTMCALVVSPESARKERRPPRSPTPHGASPGHGCRKNKAAGPPLLKGLPQRPTACCTDCVLTGPWRRQEYPEPVPFPRNQRQLRPDSEAGNSISRTFPKSYFPLPVRVAGFEHAVAAARARHGMPRTATTVCRTAGPRTPRALPTSLQISCERAARTHSVPCQTSQQTPRLPIVQMFDSQSRGGSPASLLPRTRSPQPHPSRPPCREQTIPDGLPPASWATGHRPSAVTIMQTPRGSLSQRDHGSPAKPGTRWIHRRVAGPPEPVSRISTDFRTRPWKRAKAFGSRPPKERNACCQDQRWVRKPTGFRGELQGCKGNLGRHESSDGPQAGRHRVKWQSPPASAARPPPPSRTHPEALRCPGWPASG